jgi:hypothetical protein
VLNRNPVCAFEEMAYNSNSVIVDMCLLVELLLYTRRVSGKSGHGRVCCAGIPSSVCSRCGLQSIVSDAEKVQRKSTY